MAETTTIKLPAKATVLDLVTVLQQVPQDALVWATDGGSSWAASRVEVVPWGNGVTIVEVS